MKPINKIPRLIRIATAVLVVGGLAVMVLSAQDDLDTVRQAADQGDAEAQYNLGVIYNNGEGVPKDDAEAVRWFQLAAEQGYAKAQFELVLQVPLEGRGRSLRDGFSPSVPVAATPQWPLSISRPAQQSCRRKDARSGGVIVFRTVHDATSTAAAMVFPWTGCRGRVTPRVNSDWPLSRATT